jgi:hypothetical protein
VTKQHILEEIRRTANANGGKPLGHAKFFQETGIKQSDWFGKYWARWSDAIREVGFVPNKLQGAFEDSLILEKYAELVRELGRFPAKGDLRLKRRRDETFPNEKTFVRFGSKSQLIERLKKDFEKRSGFEEVVRLCNEFASKNQIEIGEAKLSKEIIGYVYLTKFGRSYKIGKTNAAGRREYELAIQLPEKTTTVHVIKTDDPNGIEAYWHRRFVTKRKNGEWFDLSAADVSAFKRRKFM